MSHEAPRELLLHASLIVRQSCGLGTVPDGEEIFSLE